MAAHAQNACPSRPYLLRGVHSGLGEDGSQPAGGHHIQRCQQRPKNRPALLGARPPGLEFERAYNAGTAAQANPGPFSRYQRPGRC